MKTAIILRGFSGSGKTHFAQTLAAMQADSVVCEADEYFIRDGKYCFDASSLKQAHEFCFGKFQAAIRNGVSLVICANTNTQKWEFEKYIKAAQDNGYTVHVLLVENFMNTKSVHAVPEEAIARQKQSLRKSLSL